MERKPTSREERPMALDGAKAKEFRALSSLSGGISPPRAATRFVPRTPQQEHPGFPGSAGSELKYMNSIPFVEEECT
jgi:hypothetical protein